MFPPLASLPAEPGQIASNVASSLRYCMRVMPTHGDEFGGFFICILRRTRLPHQSFSASPHGGEEGRKRRCLHRPVDPTILNEIREFFGLPCTLRDLATYSDKPEATSSAVDGLELEDLVVAAEDSEGAPMLLSLVSSRVRSLTVDTCGSPSGASGPLAIAGIGTPIFCSMPSHCDWWPPNARFRVCQEAANLVGTVATRRVLRASVKAAKMLLERRQIPFAALIELQADDSLLGLETCTLGSYAAGEGMGSMSLDDVRPGAAVLIVPLLPLRDGCKAPMTSIAVADSVAGSLRSDDVLKQVSKQQFSLACLLDTSGLIHLASDEIMHRARELSVATMTCGSIENQEQYVTSRAC